jgi:hypothetical protein
MNLLFLSPAFPPTAPAFCTALAAKGVTVLGIGDEQLRPDSAEARALTHYVYEPRMGEYQVLRDATKALFEKFGPIERVDSNGEHWLVAEAKLRDDFGIPGLGSAQLGEQRSKLGMGRLFARADIPYPPIVSARDASAVRKLAKEHGYPLVFKPDSGSGAADTFTVGSDGELDSVLEREPFSQVVQPFVDGQIVTYDGLTDRDGRIVFSTSHVYDNGIMQVRRQQLDGHYYSLREPPSGLAELGRRAVAAFGIRERFFHAELIVGRDGGYTALEMNLRPPGGFTTDMMNAASGADVYALWAAVIRGERVEEVPFQHAYYTAHAGRRAGRSYAVSSEDLRRELGSRLIAEHGVPAAFAATMGDVAYLLRDNDLLELKRAIARVQARS